jgi:uncharacterized protein
MTTKYLDAVKQGRNKWWQYALGLTVIPFVAAACVVVVLMLCLLIFAGMKISDFQGAGTAKIFSNLPPWAFYMYNLPGFSLMSIGILFGIEKLHYRDPLSVICPDRTFNIKNCFNAFVLWLMASLPLNSSSAYIIYMNDAQAVKFTFDLTLWSIYLIPAILFAFVLSLFTEIIRGYALQGIGLIIRRPFLIILISSLLSTAYTTLASLKQPQSLQIQYAISSFIYNIGLAVIILKGNGLELAIGIQTASNLALRFISYPNKDSIVLPSILSIDRSTPFISSAVTIGIVALLIKLAIFYAVFLRRSLPLPESTD